MLEHFNHLQDILTRQINAYQRLLCVLEDEYAIVKNNDIDRLTRNNRLKEEIIYELETLEQDCTRVLDRISEKVPPEKRPLTLPRIIRAVKPRRFNSLKQTYRELTALADRVRKTNEDNRNCINGSLRIVKSAISFLTSCANAGTPFYEEGGRIKADNLTRAIICEEV